jgi:hypothetical protein
MMNPMEARAEQDAAAWLCWIFMGIGASLRLDQYVFNRSLWVDEAFLAANFIDKSFWQLLRPPLEYAHNLLVPPGFLALSKGVTAVAGNTDLLLRLLPLLCGLAAIGLFYRVALRFLSASAVPYAVLLFVLSDSLIYYASEFKQYSSDVVVTLLLWLLAARLREQGLTPRSLALAAFGGAVAVWFSHPSAYVLAALGGYFVVASALARQWRAAFAMILVSTLWLASFVLLYRFSTPGGVENTANGRFLVQLWRGWEAFMPSPLLPDGLAWLIKNYFDIFAYPGGLAASTVAGLLFAGGAVALWLRRRWTLPLLTLPLLIAASASYFEVYPFMGRTLLFALPALYLVLAEGIAHLRWALADAAASARVAAAWRWLLVLALLDLPVYRQQTQEEIRPVLAYVQQQRQPGDVIYLYHWTEPAFRYYAASLGFDYADCHRIAPIPVGVYEKEIDFFRRRQNRPAVDVYQTQCVLGAAELFAQSRDELQQLLARHRVWFVFTHISREEEMRFLYYLNQQGAALDRLVKKGASAYLYAF